MAPILEARQVSKRFGLVEAVREVSFSVQPGEVRALCGENGAGKSTLVKIFTGMHQPDFGTVVVDGREHRIRNPQEAQRLGIAYVSQELSITPYLSVHDNIWLGHRDVPFFHRRRSLRRMAQDALDLVGLDRRLLDRTAGGLSLGERQLLEIARDLAFRELVLLLDLRDREPLVADQLDQDRDLARGRLGRLARGTRLPGLLHARLLHLERIQSPGQMRSSGI